ncbi:MAG: hypothetical protein Q9165_005676 [Trypethelium subeluteriae]
MVASFQITSDDKQIAFYAGMVTSAFALAEFSSGVLWGRLSDMVGRKPILLCGLAGTGISMLAFGFAPSLPVALVARALGGLLNGNIGVLQTTVAEVVTVKAHQRSGLGGTLADPVKNYPSTFQPGSMFERFPYLLPNLVCAVVVVISLVIGILFLEETHEEKKHRRDFGLDCGRWILARFRSRPEPIPMRKQGYIEETLSLLVEDDDSLGYQAAKASACISCSETIHGEPQQLALDDCGLQAPTDNAVCAAFTPQIILNILSLGILA